VVKWKRKVGKLDALCGAMGNDQRWEGEEEGKGFWGGEKRNERRFGNEIMRKLVRFRLQVGV
jgi:hypothetical protein